MCTPLSNPAERSLSGARPLRSTAAGATIALFGTLAAFVSPAARAEIVNIVWSADGRFALRHELPAGAFVEACGALAAGTRIEWSFDAGAPVDFNIHYHQGQQVHYPARLVATARGRETLVAATAQDYCWMWGNKSGAALRLKATLHRRP